MNAARLRRLVSGIHREILQRRRPHGLIGLRYLWPGRDRRILLHRMFWWQSGMRWSRPLWLALEAWLWLRWVLWFALPACWRSVWRFGLAIAEQEGISRARQGWRVAKLALNWCIPPHASYQLHLYRDTQQALDYVYDSETSAYHAWRSTPLGWKAESLRLIQNKVALAESLTADGIPVVPTLAQMAGGSATLASLMGEHPRVFCKMNSGNQGRGAFAAWRTERGFEGHTFAGKPLPDTLAVEAAWQSLLRLDTALVQPCLENHPQLAPLTYDLEVITVRYISQWPDGVDPALSEPTCLSATLEIPAGTSKRGHTVYCILPIRPEAGVLLSLPALPMHDVAIRTRMKGIEALALALPPLPDWAELVRHSHAAHRRFPDIRALAWDWVLTPYGPFLLEANTGWATETPQIIRGEGFLSTVCETTRARRRFQNSTTTKDTT